MKKLIKITPLLLLLSTAIIASADIQKSTGVQDELGVNFSKTTINMGSDYDGKVVSTVVKRVPDLNSGKAVLYIHGFSDYFYQVEEADKFYEMGYNFYALDLRKYGRSVLPHQTPFTVRNLNEYYSDIDSALNMIRKEGNNQIVIVAHSMGGLIASLYTSDRKSVSGLQGLILNSPFFDFKQNKFSKAVVVPFLSFIGSFLRNIKIPGGNRSVNCESIHIALKGEWNFDTIKKPVGAGYVTTGWIRAIHKGHLKLKRGLKIEYPVLVLYSDKSSSGKRFSEISKHSDTVLDVKDIEKRAGRLGLNVKKVVIPGGIHDLALSDKRVREKYYQEISLWLGSLKTPD